MFWGRKWNFPYLAHLRVEGVRAVKLRVPGNAKKLNG